MLQYVKKYYILYFVISIVPALIFFLSNMIISGGQAGMSILVWLATIALVMVSTLVAFRVMNYAAGAYMKRLLLIFNDKCDPQEFLAQGSKLAARIKPPFNEWGSLFNSSYALANIEVGNTEKAKELIEGMRLSAQVAKKPKEAAHICLNMHEPIKVLYGVDLALLCLNEAEGLVQKDPQDADYAHCKNYIESERRLDFAEYDHDIEELLTLAGERLQNKRIFMRVRVLAAYSKANIYRELGEVDNEKRWLEFVVDHGNRLRVVEEAHVRLKEFS